MPVGRVGRVPQCPERTHQQRVCGRGRGLMKLPPPQARARSEAPAGLEGCAGLARQRGGHGGGRDESPRPERSSGAAR